MNKEETLKEKFFMKKLMVLLLISALAIFVFTGCESLIPNEGELAGTEWRLSAWSESSLDPSQFTITADFDESHISGTSAVNYYSGPYMATPNRIFSVGQLQMTLMGGSEEAMRAESTYFELLGQACKFTVNQTTLTLLGAFNNELLIFSRKEIVLAGRETTQ
jgi:heat shock protein HslJ